MGQTGSSCSRDVIIPETHILDNGFIRVGVDPNRGGSISYLAPSSPDCDYSKNLINAFDLGREIQMSFFVYEPQDYGACTFDTNNCTYDGTALNNIWRPWPWNPIGAGSVTGNPSTILDFSKTPETQTMRVVSRPKQWACDNLDCECTFEQTIELLEDMAAVKVTSTLHNARTDDYPEETAGTSAELPAVYVNSDYHRLVSYSGNQPFVEGQPITEYTTGFDAEAKRWIPGLFQATEYWAAFVNDNNWGLGVVNLAETNWLGGFSGRDSRRPGIDRSLDSPTGYMTPVSTAYKFTRDITFTYEYYLVLGNVNDIRSFATQVYHQGLLLKRPSSSSSSSSPQSTSASSTTTTRTTNSNKEGQGSHSGSNTTAAAAAAAAGATGLSPPPPPPPPPQQQQSTLLLAPKEEKAMQAPPPPPLIESEWLPRPRVTATTAAAFATERSSWKKRIKETIVGYFSFF